VLVLQVNSCAAGTTMQACPRVRSGSCMHRRVMLPSYATTREWAGEGRAHAASGRCSALQTGMPIASASAHAQLCRMHCHSVLACMYYICMYT
jgi:hypothetical protein